MLPKIQQKPGYEGYLPSSYQFVSCQQNSALDQVLAICPAIALVNTPAAIRFRVRTPNVRCRTRVSVVLDPKGVGVDVDSTPNTSIISGTGTLWVNMRTATRGVRTKNPPTRNVVGTFAAPLAIPTDLYLWGYEFEIETCGQELIGRFVPPILQNPPVVASEWHAAVSYEAVVPLCEEEWNQFLQNYGIDPVITQVLS